MTSGTAPPRDGGDLAADTPFLDDSLGTFLDRVAAASPAPGGGAVAAVAVAMAAGLCAMAARFSGRQLPDADGAVGIAERLRAEVSPLAQADALAYADVLAAMKLPRTPDPESRRRLPAALSAAADVPLAVARVAADVASLAVELARRGNPNLRGDAVTAAALAAAGARSAASLVGINMAGTADERVLAAGEYAASAALDAARAARTDAPADGPAAPAAAPDPA